MECERIAKAIIELADVTKAEWENETKMAEVKTNELS